VKPENIKIDIIVPHYGDIKALEDSFASLTSSPAINLVNKIILVENGPETGAKAFCRKIENADVEYIYSKKPGLSNARNLGIESSTADFLIFFDNDLKYVEQTLYAYETAFHKYGQKFFYGGPVAPVYETPPHQWMLAYVPPSVKGFSLGDVDFTSDSGVFLGGNHALSREAISACFQNYQTVYEGESATGSNGGGVGEEHRLQSRLLHLGFKSCYVSKAKVFHPVPNECLTHEWICNRRFRRGLTDARKDDMFKSRVTIRNTPLWVFIRFVKSALLEKLFIALNPQAALEHGTTRAWCSGVISARSDKKEIK